MKICKSKYIIYGAETNEIKKKSIEIDDTDDRNSLFGTSVDSVYPPPPSYIATPSLSHLGSTYMHVYA